MFKSSAPLMLSTLLIAMLSVSASASKLSVIGLEIEPGVVLLGESGQLVGVVENAADSVSAAVELKLKLPAEAKLADGQSDIVKYASLRPGEVKQLVWNVSGLKAGRWTAELTLAGGNAKQATFLVVEKRDPRVEYEAVDGSWNLMPRKTTLQAGNTAPMSEAPVKSSKEIKSNYFGIVTHVERDKDTDTPWDVSHLVDGNPDTYWSTRAWRISTPLKPEYVQIDLGRKHDLSEIRLLPCWHNQGFPKCFDILASLDGKTWQTAASLADYTLAEQPAGGALRAGDRSYQVFPVKDTAARYVRIAFFKLQQNAGRYSCSPMDPFMAQLGEIVLVDSKGSPIAVSPKAVSSTSLYTCWNNTASSLAVTCPMLYTSGSKWTRISQWGDLSDWAAIEKTKGVYEVDPFFDKKITEQVNSGITVVWTLDYGNDIYQPKPGQPKDLPPTWYIGNPDLRSAPTTDAAIKGFCDFAAFLVKHFKGRVNHWEVWNEENFGFFFDGVNSPVSVINAKNYGKLLTAVARRIKQEDPNAQVYFGGIALFSIDYFQTVLEEGAAPFIDGVAYHPYRGYFSEGPSVFGVKEGDAFRWDKPSGYPNYEAEVAAVRAALDKIKPGLKLMVTEQNCFAPGEPAMPEMADLSEVSQAKMLARAAILHTHLRIPLIWWSLFNMSFLQEWAVVRSADMTPRLAYHAGQTIGTMMDGAEPSPLKIEVAKAAPQLYAKVFENTTGEVLVALWCAEGAPNDNYQPHPVDFVLPGVRAVSGTVCDTLRGLSQAAVIESDAVGTRVSGVLTPDYPVVVRLKVKK